MGSRRVIGPPRQDDPDPAKRRPKEVGEPQREPGTENPDLAHERRDVNLRVIIWGGVGLAAVVIGTMLVLGVAFGFLQSRAAEADVPLSPLGTGQALPPAPRLQVNPRTEWDAKRAADEQVLNSYGWVDQQAGVARIPIDRAIELLAGPGAPAQPEGAQEQPTTPAENREGSGGHDATAIPETTATAESH